jgi:hypothetical protein
MNGVRSSCGDIGGQAPLEFAVGLDSIGHLIERLAEEPDRVVSSERRVRAVAVARARRASDAASVICSIGLGTRPAANMSPASEANADRERCRPPCKAV